VRGPYKWVYLLGFVVFGEFLRYMLNGKCEKLAQNLIVSRIQQKKGVKKL
jgi:hypothetical protein